MSPYRPASAAPLTLPLGTWVATGKPDRTAVLTADPRLFAWMVQQAARRSTLLYQERLGTPPLTISLT